MLEITNEPWSRSRFEELARLGACGCMCRTSMPGEPVKCHVTMHRRHTVCLCLAVVFVGMGMLLSGIGFADELKSSSEKGQGVEYGDVRPLMVKYCVGCHNEKEYESGLRLHTLAAIRRGGDAGSALVAGKPDESLIWRRISGLDEPKMPPEDSAQPSAAEVELIRRWIELGAIGKDIDVPLKDRLRTSKSQHGYRGPSPITAMTEVHSPLTHSGAADQGAPKALGTDQARNQATASHDSSLILLGHYGYLESLQGQWRSRLGLEIVGKVTQIRPSSDGRLVVVSSGVPGVGGSVQVIDAASLRGTNGVPRVIRVLEGHADIIYSAVLSPDGTILATGGYDRVIRLWDMKNGGMLRALEGHNGAVYDLDFDRSGSVLASASADETIKIWKVATGERLDTLGQGEAEQYTVRFSSSGSDSLRDDTVIASGADRRIRVWRLLSKEIPTVSPMLHSVFAHESPVNQLVFSADQRWALTSGEDLLVKLWRTSDWRPIASLGQLPDVASGLVWMEGERSEERGQVLATTLQGEIVRLELPPASEMARWAGQSQNLSSKNVEASQHMNAIAPRVETQAVTNVPEVAEMEGVHREPTHAQTLQVPVRVRGLLTAQDAAAQHSGDWYAFDAQQGVELVISVDAARSGSPLDSVLDIADASGKPLLRTRLQAVRESYFTFRGKDSTTIDDFRLHRWEDMELNQWLYAGGEVVKLWLYPRGPDSGFKVYPGFGQRFTFFGTSASTHALNEPAWIVEEIAPGDSPSPNGLPVFPVYYTNDDDPDRHAGKDSVIRFLPPQDGKYLIRLRDSRGEGGEKYSYTLSIAAPQSRFQLRIDQSDITLRPEVGTEFNVSVSRFDGLDDAIELQFDELPRGIRVAQPLTIEPNQLRAIGQMSYDQSELAALPKEFELSLRAKSTHRGGGVVAEQVAKLSVKISDKPAMKLKLVAKDSAGEATPLTELRIRPGQTVSAKLMIERGDLQGDISFGGDDSGRNLPHGCFVDNIGLSGLLIPAGQSTREVFITAAPITTKQERLFHLRCQVDGNPTTIPIKLIVE
ncbi:MAG: hypothetical protein FJ308_11980 [Planctomycetes bacterium]|nr:hypothetical protein [Planctomycetota bacterium]